MELTIESFRPGDEERRHALGRQAFGATNPFDPDAPMLDPARVVCAYAGDLLVGTVITLDFAMTWGGRAVPCGGVSGVIVSPEARGRGAARHMLAESFHRMVERGEVISALYPTTASLYRSMGYEVVGWFVQRRIPLDAVDGVRAEALTWRQVELDDPALLELHDAMSARHDGWFRADPGWWAYRTRRAAQETSVNRFAYVGRRGGTDAAALQFRYTSSEVSLYDLDAELVAGADGDAVGAALSFLAGHGTTVDSVQTALPAAFLAPHIPQLQRTTVRSDWPWMLRLVDVPAAIQARGWPRGVQGRVELDVVDGVLPANAGPHVLEIDDGEANLVRGGAGRVTVTAQDLAMLYSGCDVQALRAAGRLVEATGDDLDLLATAFVANPTIPFFF